MNEQELWEVNCLLTAPCCRFWTPPLRQHQFEILTSCCFSLSISLNFSKLNLTVYNFCFYCLFSDSLSPTPGAIRKWVVWQSPHLKIGPRVYLNTVSYPSKCEQSDCVFISGQVKVYLRMLSCDNTAHLTIRFLNMAKFTSLTIDTSNFMKALAPSCWFENISQNGDLFVLRHDGSKPELWSQEKRPLLANRNRFPRRSNHVTAATDTKATIEEFLEEVFSVGLWGGYIRRVPEYWDSCETDALWPRPWRRRSPNSWKPLHSNAYGIYKRLNVCHSKL
jgi:hypothetical protein